MKHPPHKSRPHPEAAHSAARTYRLPSAAALLTTGALATVKRIEAALEAARRDRHTIFAVTLTPGFEVRGEHDEMRLWATVREWNAAMDCGPLGFSRNHLYRAIPHRPAYALVFQHGHTTWHYHGTVSVLAEQIVAYERDAHRLWRAHSHGGSMKLEPLRDAGWHQYSVRKVEAGDEAEWQPKLLLRTLPERDFHRHFPEPACSTGTRH